LNACPTTCVRFVPIRVLCRRKNTRKT
jgi:hypothetical protein